MTAAARRFLAEVEVSWDTSDPWEMVAAHGPSDVDVDVLFEYAQDENEDYRTACHEVWQAARDKVQEQLVRDLEAEQRIAGEP
jgi:hypothetical protein